MKKLMLGMLVCLLALGVMTGCGSDESSFPLREQSPLSILGAWEFTSTNALNSNLQSNQMRYILNVTPSQIAVRIDGVPGTFTTATEFRQLNLLNTNDASSFESRNHVDGNRSNYTSPAEWLFPSLVWGEANTPYPSPSTATDNPNRQRAITEFGTTPSGATSPITTSAFAWGRNPRITSVEGVKFFNGLIGSVSPGTGFSTIPITSTPGARTFAQDSFSGNGIPYGVPSWEEFFKIIDDAHATLPLGATNASALAKQRMLSVTDNVMSFFEFENDRLIGTANFLLFRTSVQNQDVIYIYESQIEPDYEFGAYFLPPIGLYMRSGTAANN